MPEVLLVMRRAGNVKVLGAALAGHGYAFRGVHDRAQLEEVLDPEVLDRSGRPSAALVDVTGYRDEVWPMCTLLQGSQVPFLVVSGSDRHGFGSQGLAFGAVGVLTKPLVKASLLKLLAGLTGR